MLSRERICKNCEIQFEITDSDLSFYHRVSPVINGKKFLIPAPSFCPDCRRQRRLSFRNERTLYRRKCDKTGKDIVSLYAPDSPYIVYNHDIWWEDGVNFLSNGKEFDFSRTFFEQFKELSVSVPRLSLHIIGNQNCDYVNQCGYSNNCYLSFNTDFSESCYYCCNVLRSKDCIDVLNGEKSELCYGSVDLNTCYLVFFSSNCKNSNNLYFCTDMIGCSDCFGCFGLRNKKNCFYNEQLTKDEYNEKIAGIDFGSSNKLQEYKNSSNQFRLKKPHCYAHIIQCENSRGDYLANCKNALDCFDSFSNQDIRYCTVTSTCKDTYDFDVGGYECELCLEVLSSGDKNYHCLFALNHWGNTSDTLYCDTMVKCQDCFGCIGLLNKQYCILNKQYTREEYEELVPKIIEHMQNTGEWGEFFPSALSPFCYNETVANEYSPLTKDEAKLRGYRWKDIDKKEYQKQTYQISDSIKDISDDICKEILACETCSKNYKIIAQEFHFYNDQKVPIPRQCPDCRHKERMSLRNPRKLYDRHCLKCEKPIQTAYPPTNPEIVYCEECYLKEIY